MPSELVTAPVVEYVTVSLPRLPPAFDGLRIGLISDLHAGLRWQGAAGVAEVVRTINGLAPDIVLLLGDIVHFARDGETYIPRLRHLKALGGIWACLGNHEHGFVWYSRYLDVRPGPTPEDWRAMYAASGMRVLVNEADCLSRGGARLWLAGVDDAYSGRDDLAGTLGASGDGCRLALTHSPDLIDHERIGDVDLVLAGHTHGGQIHLPGLGPLVGCCRRPRQRAAGLMTSGAAPMYVTRGAGEGFPVRWRCPREVTLLTLRAGPRR